MIENKRGEKEELRCHNIYIYIFIFLLTLFFAAMAGMRLECCHPCKWTFLRNGDVCEFDVCIATVKEKGR